MVRNFSWFCNLFIRTWSKHQYYHSSILIIVLTLHTNLKKHFKEILNINFLWQRVEIFEEDSRKEEVFVLYNTLSNPYYGRSSFHGWKWHNVFCVDKDWRKRDIFDEIISHGDSRLSTCLLRMRVFVLKTYGRISYAIRAFGDSLFVVFE